MLSHNWSACSVAEAEAVYGPRANVTPVSELVHPLIVGGRQRPLPSLCDSDESKTMPCLIIDGAEGSREGVAQFQPVMRSSEPC